MKFFRSPVDLSSENWPNARTQIVTMKEGTQMSNTFELAMLFYFSRQLNRWVTKLLQHKRFHSFHLSFYKSQVENVVMIEPPEVQQFPSYEGSSKPVYVNLTTVLDPDGNLVELNHIMSDTLQ